MDSNDLCKKQPRKHPDLRKGKKDYREDPVRGLDTWASKKHQSLSRSKNYCYEYTPFLGFLLFPSFLLQRTRWNYDVSTSRDED